MRLRLIAVLLCAVITLAACGGGGDATPTVPPGSSSLAPSSVGASGDKHLFVAAFTELSVYNESNGALVAQAYETSSATCANAAFRSIVSSADGSTLYLAQEGLNGSQSGMATFNTQTNTFGKLAAYAPQAPGGYFDNLILAPNGRTIYAIAFSSGVIPIGGTGIITYDTVTQKFATLANIQNATSMAQDPNTGLLYVVAGSKTTPGHPFIDVVNPATGAIVATFDAFSPGAETYPAGLAIDPVLGHLYTELTGEITQSYPQTEIVDVSETNGAPIDTIAQSASFEQFNSYVTNQPIVADAQSGQLYAPYYGDNVAAYQMTDDGLALSFGTALNDSSTPIGAMSLSPDGQRLYLQNAGDIWLFSVARGVSTEHFTTTPVAQADGLPLEAIYAQ